MTGRVDSVLLTGATGFVGRHLHPILLRAGFDVWGASRDPDRAAEQFPGLRFRRIEMRDPSSIAAALEGCDAAVYLVHGMASSDGDYESAEQRMATEFLDAAERAGVRRIVYLGGVRPRHEPSKHLRSRLRTGEILRSGAISTIELQASMIIGAESESWRIVRDLAMRLPVMVLPRWLESRTQPIAIEDVTFALCEALELEHDGSLVAAVPGPEILTGREILERIARLRGMSPRIIEVPLITPRLSSYWIRLVTRADFRVARQLVEGLTDDLVADEDDEIFWKRFPEHRLRSFDDAARRALATGQEELSLRARVLERLIRACARSWD